MARPKAEERKVQFSMHVNQEVYDEIERRRGLVKRSTFVEDIISDKLGIEV